MKIEVTKEDMEISYLTALSNPISRAVRRATGQSWYVFDGTNVRPMRSPLQSVALPHQVSRWWQQYQEYKDKDLKAVRPIEFELDIT